MAETSGILGSFGDTSTFYELSFFEETPSLSPSYFIILTACAIGLLFNLAAIVTIVASQSFMKSITHWYILQIFVAETIFLITLPFRAVEIRNNSWIFPEWTCAANQAVTFVCYYALILFLMILCGDRYLAVRHRSSKKVRKIRKLIPAVVVSICVWIACILLAVPTMIYSRLVGIAPTCRCALSFENNDYESRVNNCIRIGGFSEKFCRNTTPVEFSYCSTIDLSLSSLLFEYESEEISGSGDADLYGGVSLSEINFEYDFGSFSGNGIFSGSGSSNINHESIPASCHYFDKPIGWVVFIAFNFAILLALFVVTVIVYGIILTQPNKTEPESEGSQESKLGSQWMTGICAALVITFIVCWLPLHSVHIAKLYGIFGQTGQYCNDLVQSTAHLSFFNPVLNPIIYSLLLIPFIVRKRSSFA